MGKVYDALRKAESERSRRDKAAGPIVPAVDWDPPARAREK